MKKDSVILINLPTYVDNICSQSNYVNIISEILGEEYDLVYTASENIIDPFVNEKTIIKLKHSKNTILRTFYYIKFYISVLLFLIRNPRVTVISFSESVLPFYLSRQFVILHDLLQLDFPRSRLVWLFYRFWVVPLCRRAGKVITTSDSSRKRLLKSNINSDVVFRMYSKIDVPVVAKNDSPSDIYDAVFVGTLAKHKDFISFAEAARSFSDRKFLAILPKRDCKSVEGLNIDNLTVFSELTIDDYWMYLRSSSVFVSTSLDEGFGPIYDAALVGIPSVVSDIPVYRELYSECSLFFEPRSVSSLRQTLNNIFQNPPVSTDYSKLTEKVDGARGVFKNIFIQFIKSKI